MLSAFENRSSKWSIKQLKSWTGDSIAEKFDGVSSLDNCALLLFEDLIIIFLVFSDDLFEGDFWGDETKGEFEESLLGGLGLDITVSFEEIFLWFFSYLLDALILAILGLYNSYLVLWLFFVNMFSFGFVGKGLGADICF